MKKIFDNIIAYVVLFAAIIGFIGIVALLFWLDKVRFVIW